MESTDLIPLDGDVAKITRKAEEFKDLHDALQRNLQVYLPLTMEALAAVHQSIKNSATAETTRQMVCTQQLHYASCPHNVFVADIDSAQEKIKVAHGVWRHPQV
jgi:predicted GNAT family acetyltransferase